LALEFLQTTLKPIKIENDIIITANPIAMLEIPIFVTVEVKEVVLVF
jgi:hypothetical protein